MYPGASEGRTGKEKNRKIPGGNPTTKYDAADRQQLGRQQPCRTLPLLRHERLRRRRGTSKKSRHAASPERAIIRRGGMRARGGIAVIGARGEGAPGQTRRAASGAGHAARKKSDGGAPRRGKEEMAWFCGTQDGTFGSLPNLAIRGGVEISHWYITILLWSTSRIS